ncbi:Hsp20/alpha crystallin family protein [bacterium]|nr:Hsp20/alpha crystallin family protein [bacterium]
MPLLASRPHHYFPALFNDFTDLSSAVNSAWTKSGYSIPVDIVSNPDQVVITAEIPGVEKEAIEIEYKDQVLTIAAERKSDDVTEGAEKTHSEIHSGKYTRSIKVRTEIDFTKAC